MPRLLVVNIASLSFKSFGNEDAFADLRAFFQGNNIFPLRPSFPALTSTVQASLTTGVRPEKHGIVANGYYDRDRMRVHFWEQSDRLCQAPRVWDALKRKNPSAKTAILFWQNSIGSGNDIILTPAPIHKHHGGMIQDCYSKPDGLYGELASKLGRFNLHWYWGPLTSIRATNWIARATADVLKRFTSDLVLTYLPHLDYNLQRLGHSHARLSQDYRELAAAASELVHEARRMNYEVLLVSDYAMSDVTAPVWVNRALRKAGLLNPRKVGRREYLDYGQTLALAMADHQVAHVYCLPEAVEAARGVLCELDGVERVLGPEEQKEMGVRHARSGELIAIARKDRWFAYPWWEDRRAAPDFATHVDIHNKPGYDPLELFFDWRRFGTSQDARLVRGSHGRLPESPNEHAALAATFPVSLRAETPRDTDTHEIILQASSAPL